MGVGVGADAGVAAGGGLPAGGIVGSFHGDQRLASLQPSADLAPPSIPSTKRIAALDRGPAVTFDDSVSGRHYTIAGELEGIDAPNEQKATSSIAPTTSRSRRICS